MEAERKASPPTGFKKGSQAMSQVLVDTSVWVEMFRNANSPEVHVLGDLMRNGLVCVSGLVLAEILSGARSTGEFKKLKGYFSAFEYLEDPPTLWEKVGHYRYSLARKGIQSSIADLVVATAASYHRRHLFTLDKDFELIAGIVPFKLFKPIFH